MNNKLLVTLYSAFKFAFLAYWYWISVRATYNNVDSFMEYIVLLLSLLMLATVFLNTFYTWFDTITS